ncbi:MAG: Stp1/IreP family PP2C-type Ser/Thr phosphatase, partial [Desulfomonilaceae bacterium]
MRKARSHMPIPVKNTGLKVGYLTDPGRQRRLNEDSFYVNQDIGLFIVADGMGGHNAGEVASSIAVTVVSNLIEGGIASAKDPVELVRQGMSNANETILENSMNNTAWSEMGTTLLVALFADHGLVIGHVGDSRAYSIGKGRIRQLTQDHTFVAEWLREGRITKEQARSHHQRHGLTEALGVTKDVESEITIWPWEGHQCLLLCSDGLTEMIEDEEILATINSSDNPQQACENLVAMANQKGGRDNIT